MSHLWSFPLFFNHSSFNYFKIFIMEIFQGYNERENSIPHPHTYHLSSTINFLVFLFSLFSPTFCCCCFVCVKYLKENHRHSILSVVFQYVFLTNKDFFHTIYSIFTPNKINNLLISFNITLCSLKFFYKMSFYGWVV